MTVLSLDLNKLQRGKINITEFIEDFWSKLENYCNRNGSTGIIQDFRKKRRFFHSNIFAEEISFTSYQ